MPSRQERRKAERDAAKRAPGQAGAAGAAGAAGTAGIAGAAGAAGTGGAAAPRANANTNPVGDWTTQASVPGLLFQTLGVEVVKQRQGAHTRPLLSST
jgi:hypothetical protein